LQDEEEPSERHVQPRLDVDPRQLPLISLTSLQPDARALVIVLEAEAMLIGGHQVVFEGCLKITNESQIVSRFSNEVDYHLWFRDPLNHLGKKQRTNYIALML
jgi:hypothetical protein